MSSGNRWFVVKIQNRVEKPGCICISASGQAVLNPASPEARSGGKNLLPLFVELLQKFYIAVVFLPFIELIPDDALYGPVNIKSGEFILFPQKIL